MADTDASTTNPESPCPVCRDSGSEPWAVGHDRLFGRVPGSFRLRRCSSCRCIFQDPLPGPGEIRSFYPSGYWWSEDAGTGGSSLLRRLERVYREFVAADHVRFLVRCARREGATGGRLLDIGCGSGTFLHLARGREFGVHGMDASEEAVSAGRKQYGLDLRCGEIGSAVWDRERFDFVTMFHVLEHLAAPEEALAYADGLLSPGGSLIVQVPNVESLQARFFRERWYGLDVPRHLVNFSPDGLERLLRRSGFEVRTVARFSLRDNPASIASSLAPGLDPIGRRVRAAHAGALSRLFAEAAYFVLVVLALPPALLESAVGRGGTTWVHAKRSGE